MKWEKESKKKRPTKEEITAAMKQGIVKLDFLKADGSVRFMNGTLQSEYIPESQSKGTKVTSDDVISCIDFNLKAWRSFRLDSLIKVEA